MCTHVDNSRGGSSWWNLVILYNMWILVAEDDSKNLEGWQVRYALGRCGLGQRAEGDGRTVQESRRQRFSPVAVIPQETSLFFCPFMDIFPLLSLRPKHWFGALTHLTKLSKCSRRYQAMRKSVSCNVLQSVAIEPISPRPHFFLMFSCTHSPSGSICTHHGIWSWPSNS